VIQDDHSKCTDEKTKEEYAMKFHTTRRSFVQRIFCCPADVEEWKATLRGGLVFKLAEVRKLWFNNKFSFEHIKDTKRFQESLPYHPKTLSKGKRFEIYLQAFCVIDKAKFLPEAKLLYLALDKKSKHSWDSMLPMFTAFLEGKSFYYVGRSIKGGIWRYWGTLGAARDKKGASGYAKQTVVGIMQKRLWTRR
jgi:hypothetical protein